MLFAWRHGVYGLEPVLYRQQLGVALLGKAVGFEEVGRCVGCLGAVNG